MLRYAHARAERLGIAVHFSQQSAEHTDFPDESFDVVYSAALIHETSHTAVPNITREMRRLLRPGGVAVHLEVPIRYDDLDLWGHLIADFERREDLAFQGLLAGFWEEGDDRVGAARLDQTESVADGMQAGGAGRRRRRIRPRYRRFRGRARLRRRPAQARFRRAQRA